MKPTARRAVYQLVLFALTLAAVSWLVARDFRKLSSYALGLDWPLVALSLCAVIAAYLVRFGVWTRLSAMMGLHAPTLRAGRAYFLSVLGRYIPGKVGLTLVRIEAYRGSSADTVILATGIEMIAALAAAFLLAFIGLASSPGSFPSYLRWAPLVGLVPLFAALTPAFMKRTANMLLRLAGRKEVGALPPYRANVGLVLLYTIPGFLHGLGLFFLLNAFAHIPAAHYLAVTGVYYAANLVGLLAVFAPGGLGVREGILFLVLPALVGKEIAIISAILMRLVTIAAELVLAGVFAAAARRR